MAPADQLDVEPRCPLGDAGALLDYRLHHGAMIPIDPKRPFGVLGHAYLEIRVDPGSAALWHARLAGFLADAHADGRRRHRQQRTAKAAAIAALAALALIWLLAVMVLGFGVIDAWSQR